MTTTTPCFIGLGSNLGDRSANLARARREIDRTAGKIRAESSIYETAPWGVAPGQPDYLNQVVMVETERSPRAVLDLLHRTERSLGRVRETPGEPRLIDLDLLLYGDRTIDEPGLTVPHPRMTERAFVLAPLAEIAPGLDHPATGKTIRQLLCGVDRSGVSVWEDHGC